MRLFGLVMCNGVPLVAPWRGGIFLTAVNFGHLVDIDEFKAEVDGLIRNCRSSRLAQGFNGIIMPGERAMKEAEPRWRETLCSSLR